jgi:hypothetical protein
MIMYYSTMLHNTWYGWAVKGGIPWLWPAFETLHFFGMALLVGCVGALDLRMLGLGKGLPLGPLQKLVPFGILGFAINLITGLGFYAGDPSQYQSGAFFWKMTFILLAGCNVILFYVTGLHRRVDLLGAGADVPLGAKFIAGVSLFLWLGVMFWGRMLPVFSNAF